MLLRIELIRTILLLVSFSSLSLTYFHYALLGSSSGEHTKIANVEMIVLASKNLYTLSFGVMHFFKIEEFSIVEFDFETE
jgi:hypothetical protein